MNKLIYLDHAATTPLKKEVLDEMLPFLTMNFGNPSSVYSLGRESKMAVEKAREQVARAIGCETNEIYFTASGTESDNWALRGMAAAGRGKGNHIITTAVEHHAVLHTCHQLEEEGYELTYLPVDKEGMVQVEQLLAANKVNFRTYKDQVVFEWDEVLKQDGLPYTVFTPYSRVWKKKLYESKWIEFDSENHLSDFVSCEWTNVPELSDIGFSKTGIQYLKPQFSLSVIENYDKTRDIPANEKGTTGLSVHLRFGTVSIRYLVGLAKDMNEIWLNELIWREFFMSIIMHFPYVVNRSFKKQYDEIKWQNDEAAFERWCNGTTGYPIVDAGMRQLNETGLMHNRVRMIVASFLVKDLLIDWRWGEAYFAQKLLDYDLSANNGNWQWAAGCGCDAAPYFRIFNPAEQTKRYDPKLEYIQRWVKELNTFDYPAPIVDHSIARERTLNTFKAALKSDD